MNVFLLPIVQGIFLLSIIVLAYRTVMIVLDTKATNKFVLKQYLTSSEKESKDKVGRITLLERVTSIKKYIEYTEMELRENKSDLTVQAFIIKRLIISITMMLFVLAVYWISDNSFLLYLVLPIGVLCYILPKRQLKVQKQRYDKQLQLEIRKYLLGFAVSLRSYTPFE
ncbi:hypothetical protein, partial [Bacillus sp. JJ722]|uniref:hypothetical protein n=1 Tax=Bacillus sp. JJ722 TaxID=3122973 RepID=UPI002FFDB951